MSQAQTPEEGIDLREYLAILRQRRWTIVLTTLLVTTMAVLYSLSQPARYTSQAKVLVKSLENNIITNPALPDVNLQTEAEIVQSEPVAALVRDDVGVRTSLDTLLASLRVNGIAQTEVLEISFVSADPQLAQQVADSFSRNYLTYRVEQALEDIAVEEEAAQSRLEAATTQLAELAEDLRAAEAANDQALVTTLETSRNVLVARLGVVQQQLDDLQAERASRRSGGSVIEDAEVPEAPSSPDHVVNTVLGFLVGITAGIGAAFVRERLDDRFRGREDVERALRVPVLALIPAFPGSRRKRTSEVISITNPDSIAAENYRSLRTNLQFISAQAAIKTVIVTSPSAGEGKTITSANLAAVLAQAGKRVILISADLRRPTLERYFGLREGSEPGLSTWLSGQGGDVLSLLHDPGIPNMRIVPSGPLPPNPAELLGSARLGQLIHALEQNSDLVIFDSPPVLAVADSTILTARAGGTLLVLDATATHRAAAIHAREELERVGGNVVGCVLNGYDASSSPYYSTSYRYYGTDKAERAGSAPGSREAGEPKRRIFALRR